MPGFVRTSGHSLAPGRHFSSLSPQALQARRLGQAHPARLIRWIVPSLSTTNVVRLASLMNGIKTSYRLKQFSSSSLRMGNRAPSSSANFCF
jgi:hypothetical protein